MKLQWQWGLWAVSRVHPSCRASVAQGCAWAQPWQHFLPRCTRGSVLPRVSQRQSSLRAPCSPCSLPAGWAGPGTVLTLCAQSALQAAQHLWGVLHHADRMEGTLSMGLLLWHGPSHWLTLTTQKHNEREGFTGIPATFSSTQQSKALLHAVFFLPLD